MDAYLKQLNDNNQKYKLQGRDLYGSGTYNQRADWPKHLKSWPCQCEHNASKHMYTIVNGWKTFVPVCTKKGCFCDVYRAMDNLQWVVFKRKSNG